MTQAPSFDPQLVPLDSLERDVADLQTTVIHGIAVAPGADEAVSICLRQFLAHIGGDWGAYCGVSEDGQSLVCQRVCRSRAALPADLRDWEMRLRADTGTSGRLRFRLDGADYREVRVRTDVVRDDADRVLRCVVVVLAD